VAAQAQIPTTQLTLWLKADAGVVKDASNNVSEWQDQSGNGFHPAQPTLSRQPKWVENQINGKPALQFINKYLELDFLQNFSQPNTIFVVWNSITATSETQPCFDAISSSNRCQLSHSVSDPNSIGLSAGSSITYPKQVPFEFIVSSAIFNGSNGMLFENGILLSSGNTGTAKISGFRLGTNYVLTRWLRGSIAEIIFYNTLLSEAERKQVEKYLMDKYSPALDLGEDIQINYGFCDTTLSVNPVFTNILWSTGETSPQISVNQSGTYWVQVQDNFNRLRTDSIHVEYPQKHVIATGEFLCFDSVLALNPSLSESAEYTYVWNNSNTDYNNTVNQAGSYWFTLTDNQGCSAVSDTLDLETDYFPETFSLGNDTILCAGNYFAAAYHPQWDYVWGGGETTPIIQVIDPGEYTITATDQFGCVARDTTIIDIQGVAPVSDFAFPAKNCINTEIVFENLSTGVELTGFLWDFGDGSAPSSNENPVHQYTHAGTYQVRLDVFSASGCNNFMIRSLQVFNNPHAAFSTTQACPGHDVYFLDTSNPADAAIDNYQWDFGNGNSSDQQHPTTVYTMAQAYQVKLKITDENGCTDTLTQTLHVAQQTAPAPQAQIAFPYNNYHSLQENIDFEWTTQLPEVLYCSWQLAENSDFENVLFEESFNLPENGQFWTETTASFHITQNLEPGLYYWRVLTFNSCQELTVGSTFGLRIIDTEAVLLHFVADSVELASGAGNKITNILDISGNGMHAVQSDANNMANWVASALNSKPAVQFGQTQANYYNIDELTLGNFTVVAVHKPDPASLAVHYLLSGNASEGLFTHGNLISGPGVFDGENMLNAGQNYINWQISSIDNGHIYKNSNEVAYGSQTSMMGLTFKLLGSRINALSTQYFKGQLAELLIFGKQLNSEERNAVEQYLRLRYYPPVSLGPDVILSCGTCQHSILAPPGFSSYAWSTGQTGTSVTVTQSGNYSLTVTDIFGYTSSDVVYVQCPQQSCLPAPELGDDILVEYGFCPVTLSVNNIYQSYQWSHGATTHQTSVNQTGMYYVTTTSSDGFSFTDSVFVSYPTININDTILCFGNSAILNPGLSGSYTYLWSNSSMSTQITVSHAGNYWVQLTDTSGCSRMRNIHVEVDHFSENISLGNDTNLCLGNHIGIVTGNNLISSYVWMPGGSTDPELYVNQSGAYSLTVTNQNGCIAYDTMYVEVSGIAPTPNFVHDGSCRGSATLFTDISESEGDIISRIWVFNNMDTLQGHTVQYPFTEAGSQQVQLIVSSEGNCSADTTIFIDIFDVPQVHFSYLPVCTTQTSQFVSEIVIPETDELESLQWTIDDVYVGNEAVLLYQFNNEGEYVVRCNATLSNGCGVSYEETVNVQSNYPLAETVHLHSPLGVVYESSIDFEWNHSENAIYYQLIISESPQFETWIIKRDSLFNNNYPVDFLMQFDTLYWKINAFNPCGNITESETGMLWYFSPNQVPGLTLWLSADSVESSNNLVSTWYDQSGHMFHPKQNTASLKPSLIPNAINGKPALRFNNDYLEIDFGQTISQPNTVLVLWKTNAATGETQPAFDGLTTSNRCMIIHSVGENNSIAANAGNSVSYPKPAPFNFILSTATYNGANGKVFENGILLNEGNIGNLGIKGFRIGANAYPSRYLVGDITDLIFYNGQLSETQRTSVENYLMDKYTPHLDLGPDMYLDYGFCFEDLSVHSDFVSVNWSTGENTHSINIQAPGEYSVEAIDIFGRIHRDTINIIFPQLTDPTSIMFCQGGSTTWDTGLGNNYTYQWLPNGETTASINISTPGNYSVLVTDSLGCQLLSNTIHFEIDDYSQTTSIGPSDTTLCAGNSLYLLNNQDETIFYQWSTGSTDAQIIITEAGLYSVTTTNVTGCTVGLQTQVNISGVAPSPNFNSSGHCVGSVVEFTDLSTGNGSQISAWEWQINGVQFSNQQSPTYLFTQPGDYVITLIVSAGSCTNFISKTLNIDPAPIADFIPDHCCGNSNNTLVSTSQIDNGYIAEQLWTIEGAYYQGSEVMIALTQETNLEVTLIALSGTGCSDTLTRVLEVRPAPLPEFSFSPVCYGSPVYFDNSTITAPNNPPQFWNWNFGDGNISTNSNPQHQFVNSGNYVVSLEMGYLNGCRSSSSQDLLVPTAPIAGIANLGCCIHEIYQPGDMSTSSAGEIVSWEWVIQRPDESMTYDTFHVQLPSVPAQHIGVYYISLEIVTDRGCRAFTETSYSVLPKPVSGFSASSVWGGIPLNVEFANSSTNAETYLWEFGDGGISFMQNPVHEFSDTGIFTVQLVSFSEYGCSDTASSDIHAVIPVFDILLMNPQVRLQNKYLISSVTIVNNGSVSATNLEMKLNIPSVGEFVQIVENLQPGQVLQFTFSNQLYMATGLLPEIVCMEATPDILCQYTDSDIKNNRVCVSSVEELFVCQPYPNPASEILILELYNPVESGIEITFWDYTGHKINTFKIEQVHGYYRQEVNVLTLNDGLYVVRVTNGVTAKKLKFIKLGGE